MSFKKERGFIVNSITYCLMNNNYFEQQPAITSIYCASAERFSHNKQFIMFNINSAY